MINPISKIKRKFFNQVFSFLEETRTFFFVWSVVLHRIQARNHFVYILWLCQRCSKQFNWNNWEKKKQTWKEITSNLLKNVSSTRNLINKKNSTIKIFICLFLLTLSQQHLFLSPFIPYEAFIWMSQFMKWIETKTEHTFHVRMNRDRESLYDVRRQSMWLNYQRIIA